MVQSINFVGTEQSNRVSGGYIYNEHLLNGLADKGYEIHHYHVGNIGDMPSADHVIVDSIAVNQCADTLLQLPSPPILLCHLPPEKQVDTVTNWQHQQQSVLDRLVSRSRVVSTGTTCTKYLSACYGLPDSQLFTVMPGLTDTWLVKTEYVELPRKLLVAANLIPDKGYDLLIPALHALRHLPWTLQIFGDDRFDPEFAAGLLARIDELGLAEKVTYRGVVAQGELNLAMIESDLFIHLSAFEPFSMLTLEAVSSRLPVLSSKSGEHQWFEQSGLVRYLLELNIDVCTAALQDLLSEPASYARLRPVTQLSKRTWSQVVSEFDQVLSAN